jgi:hypothetical protein
LHARTGHDHVLDADLTSNILVTFMRVLLVFSVPSAALLVLAAGGRTGPRDR